jgi:hypothetical protein
MKVEEMNEEKTETIQNPLDVVREKYEAAPHPKSEVLTDEDLRHLPEQDRGYIERARKRRERRGKRG